jgi:Domain of Unknown Function (DUF1521)
MTIQPSTQPPTMTTIVITGGTNTAEGVPPPTTTRGDDGTISFANQHYNIDVRPGGDVNVTNKQTNETYLIQSDLRVEVDGVKAFYFEGTTTFELDDGTKITIDTAPRKAVAYAALASTALAIFDGSSDYGVLIENLDGVRPGDATFEEATIDEVSQLIGEEGNVLLENLSGEGFVAIDERGEIQSVDQEWISDTDEIQLRTRSLLNQYSGMINFISGVSQISFMGSLLSAISQENNRISEQYQRSNRREQFKLEMEETTDFEVRPREDLFESPAEELKHKLYFVLSRSPQLY